MNAQKLLRQYIEKLPTDCGIPLNIFSWLTRFDDMPGRPELKLMLFQNIMVQYRIYTNADIERHNTKGKIV